MPVPGFPAESDERIYNWQTRRVCVYISLAKFHGEQQVSQLRGSRERFFFRSFLRDILCLWLMLRQDQQGEKEQNWPKNKKNNSDTTWAKTLGLGSIPWSRKKPWVHKDLFEIFDTTSVCLKAAKESNLWKNNKHLFYFQYDFCLHLNKKHSTDFCLMQWLRNALIPMADQQPGSTSASIHFITKCAFLLSLRRDVCLTLLPSDFK